MLTEKAGAINDHPHHQQQLTSTRSSSSRGTLLLLLPLAVVTVAAAGCGGGCDGYLFVADVHNMLSYIVLIVGFQIIYSPYV